MQNPLHSGFVLSSISIAFGLLATTQPSFAGSDRGVSCVPFEPKIVHRFITHYANYANLPGATFTADFKNTVTRQIEKIEVAKITKSQARFSVPEGYSVNGFYDQTVATVLMEIRPLMSKIGAHYPRVILNCHSEPTADGFTHSCKSSEVIRDSKTNYPSNYALKSFESNAKLSSKICPGGKKGTEIEYSFNFVQDNDHILAIKKDYLGIFTPVAPALLKIDNPELAELFEGENFVMKFYRLFYKSWLESVK